jgi:hypothetical protein
VLEFDQFLVIHAFLAFRQPSKLQRHCCLYFYPPKITYPLYIEQLRETDPPPNQNIVGVCNHITLLILYYISSSSVTLLKVIDAPVQMSDNFLSYCYFQVHQF